MAAPGEATYALTLVSAADARGSVDFQGPAVRAATEGAGKGTIGRWHLVVVFDGWRKRGFRGKLRLRAAPRGNVHIHNGGEAWGSESCRGEDLPATRLGGNGEWECWRLLGSHLGTGAAHKKLALCGRCAGITEALELIAFGAVSCFNDDFPNLGVDSQFSLGGAAERGRREELDAVSDGECSELRAAGWRGGPFD